MNHPTELILQDVRCFEGEQHARLRPITLLVGENSTGKTTFLGCYAALHRMLAGPGYIDELPDFNEEPFAMGSFRDIVRSRLGPSGSIKEFKLGFAFSAQSDGPSYNQLAVTFCEEGSQPILASARMEFSNSFLEMQRSANGTTFVVPDDAPQESDLPLGEALRWLPLLADAEGPLFREHPKLKRIFKRFWTGDASRRQTLYLPPLQELVPVAPLRSKPKRTYDPVRETATPEGEHIPMLMMRLNRVDKRHWDSLHEELVAFGSNAGLFSDIKVKRHGKQMSDPFQLQVKVRSGPNANIMDVGYGISQSLPILVDVMATNGSPRRAGGRTFLLQQPEVHLHPRGQAELASLFIEAFKKRRDQFMIETHSDHIVDRVRISVRRGKLKPDHVSILYFEPTGNAVRVHNIGLDKDGNLEDVPDGYRRFFLREEDRLLGFAE